MTLQTDDQPDDRADYLGPLAYEDEQALAEAVRLLEHSSLAARLTNMFGRQIAAAGELVPAPARRLVSRAVAGAMKGALSVALHSLDRAPGPARERWHKSLAAVSGAAGGALGLGALAIELPASTTLMLRSIADVARAEGEDLDNPETALACLEVFALGGRTSVDDHMDSGYFAARALLGKSMSDAVKYVASAQAAKESAPALVKFISQVGARFGLVVSQKAAAQAIPVLGALGGAGINYAFMDHFQGLARGHFTVRRLERRYGARRVRVEYQRLADFWRAKREA